MNTKLVVTWVAVLILGSGASGGLYGALTD